MSRDSLWRYDSRPGSVGRPANSRAGTSLLKMLRFSLAGMMLMLLVSGCINLGPDYVRPDAEIQPDWIDIEGSQLSGDPPVDPRWWHTAFQDRREQRYFVVARETCKAFRGRGRSGIATIHG